MEKTKPWEYNKQRNAIVSPSESNRENNSNDDEFYGGKLICESVWDEDIANIIVAAPEMLEALQDIREWYEKNREHYMGDATPVCFSKGLSAILKATE